MPTYVKGNLWDALGRVDLLLFAANSTIDSQQHAVMGRGSAQEAKQHFPAFPGVFGAYLATAQLTGKMYGIYYTFLSRPTPAPSQWIGAFQTKRHWRQDADLSLIAYSAGMLHGILSYRDTLNGALFRSVAMPFPGIGYGQLERSAVLPILDALPDCVQIYEPAGGTS